MKATAAWIGSRSHPRSVKLALAVYILAFALGTVVHLIVLAHGLGAPARALMNHPLVRVYADSLTFLDALVVVLLLRLSRTGLLLASAIMLTDVGMNSFVTYAYVHAACSLAMDYFAQTNIAFLGFVLGSAPFLWPYLRPERARQGPRGETAPRG